MDADELDDILDFYLCLYKTRVVLIVELKSKQQLFFAKSICLLPEAFAKLFAWLESADSFFSEEATFFFEAILNESFPKLANLCIKRIDIKHKLLFLKDLLNSQWLRVCCNLLRLWLLYPSCSKINKVLELWSQLEPFHLGLPFTSAAASCAYSTMICVGLKSNLLLLSQVLISKS